jgi:succinate dehydrogenase / fumarate reductase membrane anchor subunit
MSKSPTQTIMRSGLGRARGLGSAKSGTAHWFAERVSSVALVPLTLWFILALFSLAGAPRAAVGAWLASPLNAALMLALILITFQHMAMGLQVVMEDYMHEEKPRLLAILAMKGITGILALMSIIAVLKLAIGG